MLSARIDVFSWHSLVSQKNDEQMSEEQVERELNDPTKDWNRVSSDPDFLLMNGDDQVGVQGQEPSRFVDLSPSSGCDNKYTHVQAVVIFLFSGTTVQSKYRAKAIAALAMIKFAQLLIGSAKMID